MSIFKFNEFKEKAEKLEESIKQYERQLNEIKCELEKNKKEIEKLDIEKKQVNKELKDLKYEKHELDALIGKRQDFLVRAELKYMDNISGLEFEQFCKELLEKNDFKATVTKSSGDSGGDILATKGEISYIIQCKKYSDKVGNRAVQEVYAAKGIYKTEMAIVMTNNFFTDQAIDEANKLGVELWNRDMVTTLIQIANSFKIKNLDYIPSILNEIEKMRSVNEEEIYDDDTDPLLWEAMDAVIETGVASTSFIQRKFKVPYARAGRIIDQLEERGVISGYQGNKPRLILITRERLEKLKESISNKTE